MSCLMISENASHPIAETGNAELRDAHGPPRSVLVRRVSMAWRFYLSNRPDLAASTCRRFAATNPQTPRHGPRPCQPPDPASRTASIGAISPNPAPQLPEHRLQNLDPVQQFLGNGVTVAQQTLTLFV